MDACRLRRFHHVWRVLYARCLSGRARSLPSRQRPPRPAQGHCSPPPLLTRVNQGSRSFPCCLRRWAATPMHPVASAPFLRKKRRKCSAAPCCITSNIIVQLDRCSRSSGLSAPSSALLAISCSFTAGSLTAAAPTCATLPCLLTQHCFLSQSHRTIPTHRAPFPSVSVFPHVLALAGAAVRAQPPSLSTTLQARVNGTTSAPSPVALQIIRHVVIPPPPPPFRYFDRLARARMQASICCI